MNTALSAIQARVSSEEPEGILESFVAGPMTLTLSNPDALARSYMSSSYEGQIDVGPVFFSATVGRNSVVVHVFVGGNDA